MIPSPDTGPSKFARAEIPRSSDSLQIYIRDISRARSLSMAEEAVLAARIRQGDKEAMKTLVQANLRFVVAVCRNYQHQGLSMGDLINEGNLGLIRAAQRFDETMNFKFISYAVWWIRQGILSALADQSRVMKVSLGRVGVIHKIGKANQKLEQSLGRPPRVDELADVLGLTEVEITECLQLAAAPLSLNRPVQPDGEGPLEDILEDKESDKPNKEAILSLLGKNLEEMLAGLDEREEGVIRLYYGIGRESTETLEEIAARYSLTRERVRQIKARALERLRHPSRIGKLDQFLE